MNDRIYYYTVSMYDVNTGIWEDIKKCERMDCDNAHRAISLLHIYYRNDVMDNPSFYKSLYELGKVIKWSVFRVPFDNNDNLDFSQKRLCYSLASDRRAKAKRYLTPNTILR